MENSQANTMIEEHENMQTSELIKELESLKPSPYLGMINFISTLALIFFANLFLELNLFEGRGFIFTGLLLLLSISMDNKYSNINRRVDILAKLMIKK